MTVNVLLLVIQTKLYSDNKTYMLCSFGVDNFLIAESACLKYINQEKTFARSPYSAHVFVPNLFLELLKDWKFCFSNKIEDEF